jgi:aromatic-L-amino-acid/L-tryptophan decarboxylase
MEGNFSMSESISTNYPLELSAAAMRELIGKVADRVIRHVESLPQQPAGDVEGATALARQMIEPIPTEPARLDDLLDLIFNRLVPKSFNTAGPGYLAYIPGGGLFHSAVADLISDVTNRYVGVCAAAPALSQLEANVVRWFCDLVGYPAGSGGILTSGGSLANFTAVVTARVARLPENFLSGVIYTSDQVHHSVEKAATLAGFPEANVRLIETDDRFRMRPELLVKAIESDRARGLEPFLVVASAGTTNTGAVDPLDEIASIAERERLWFHVDGAYGAFFVMTERGRRALRGLERADSITLDPHKALFLPYGTGALLVRDPATLRRVHSAGADYMPAMQDDEALVDFCEISPELSRAFRGLRVWLPMKMHGIGAFREQLDEKLDLAQWATEELRKIASIEIVAEPQLSIVAFRLHPPGATNVEINEINRELLHRINSRQRVMVTPTTVGGRYVLRICVLSFRTHLDRMQMALEDIRAAVAEVAAR